MKILGIGNALVDILIQLPDESFLNENLLPKGSMQLVDLNTSENLYKKASNYPQHIASGGSAANTINGLSKMGVYSGFIGKLGHDELGNHFLKDFESNGVNSFINHSSSASGTAIAFVTPDGERTFATYLGAAIELNANDLDESVFSQYDLLHIEGYLLQNYELIETAVRMAKSCGLKVSLDLASFNVVENNIDFLERLLPGNVDILFANEEEAKALTGLNDEEALYVMAEIAPLSILKVGENGSYIFDRKDIVKVDALKSNCIDTTGAGDLYASGFLYGLANNKSLFQCGTYGSILSGYVVRVIGAKIAENNWSLIKTQIQQIQ